MKIVNIRLVLIKSALRFINKKAVQKIDYVPLRDYLAKQLVPLKEVIDKLTNKNPNNKAELQIVWEKIKEGLKDDSIETAMEIIEREVKDETTKDILLAILKDYLNQSIPPQAA